MKCFESLKSYIPTSLPPIALKSAKLLGSLAFAGASGQLARKVYELSFLVFDGKIYCPSLELSALTCAIVATGYCSLSLARSMMVVQQSRRYIPRLLRADEIFPPLPPLQEKEIVAFSTGEKEIQKDLLDALS
jgi:hypothetical protein